MHPGATPQTRPRTVSRTHNPYAYPATPTGDAERGSATTPVDPRLLIWNRGDAPSPGGRLGQSGSGTFVHPDVDCGRPRSVQQGRSSRAERSPMVEQSAFPNQQQPYQPQRELELKVGGEYVSKVVVSTPHDVAPLRLGSSRRGPATVGNRPQGSTAPRPGSHSRPSTAGFAYPSPAGNMTPARRLDLAPTSPLVVGTHASRRTPAVERVPSPPAFGSGTGSPTDVANTMPPPPAAITPRTSPEAVFGPHVAKVVGEQPLSPPKSPRKAKEGMETLLRLYDQRPSMFAISAAIPSDECVERNANTVAGRRRQVALGQMQPEYKRYLELVPRDRREARNMAHPVTPRPEYNFSCREFKKTVHAWRCALHIYGDPEVNGNFQGGPSVYDPELYRDTTPPSGDAGAATAGTPLGVGIVDPNDDETTAILVQDVEDDARETRRTPPTTPRHQVAHSTPSGRKGATPLHRPTPLKHGNTGGATAAATPVAAPLASSRQLFA